MKNGKPVDLASPRLKQTVFICQKVKFFLTPKLELQELELQESV